MKSISFRGISALLLLCSASFADAVLYENRIVRLNNGVRNTTYKASQFIKDFGNVADYHSKDISHTTIVWGAKRLRIKHDKGKVATGILAKVKVPKKRQYYFQFEQRFLGPDYDFTRGGKFNGLCGGKCWKGGNGAQARQGDGWSFRIMWLYDLVNKPNYAKAVPYLYHKDMTEASGDTFGGLDLGRLYRDVYHTFKIQIRLNTGANRNGIVRVWLNGKLKMDKRNIRYVTKNNQRFIDTLLIENYHGGADPRWEPSRNQYQIFDNWRWSRDAF